MKNGLFGSDGSTTCQECGEVSTRTGDLHVIRHRADCVHMFGAAYGEFSFRERLARRAWREFSKNPQKGGDPSQVIDWDYAPEWVRKTVYDMVNGVIDEFMNPPVAVIDAVAIQKPLHTSTLQQWRAGIRAIMEGK